MFSIFSTCSGDYTSMLSPAEPVAPSTSSPQNMSSNAYANVTGKSIF